MRIAIAGVAHETNTFSTLSTSYDDFSIVRGDALVDGPFWRAAAAEGHEPLPLFVAHAAPSGRVTRECYERLLDELLDGLRALMPLDGLLLHLHGAMEVEQIGDGEVAILKAVRAVVGRKPQIAVTLDLHANLAPEVVADSDLLIAYRTAPHRDAVETRERGARLLLQCLEKGVRSLSHLVKLPLLIAGEQAVTEVEPAQSLYGRLPLIDRVPGVLASSILIGCAWTDSPYTGVGILVSGTDGAAVQREASQLAEDVWAARSAFQIDSPTASIEESIRLAGESLSSPVFVSDSGDNPTAGGAGDSPLFLERLVDSGVVGALVAGIADPDAVRHCFEAGVGRSFELAIGGRYDSTFAHPYRARALVKRLIPQVDDILPRALVQVGEVEVILQSSRRPFTTLHHFRSAGIDPSAKRLIVVKLGYLFPELRDFAPVHIMALSPGFTDLRLARLPFRYLLRPIYPLDPDVLWQAAGTALST